MSGKNSVVFATCNSAPSEQNKQIILNEGQEFSLTPGSSIFVSFVDDNINISPKVSIFSFDLSNKILEEKTIYYNGKPCQTENIKMAGKKKSLIHYIFDGENIQFVNWFRLDTDEVNTSSLKPWIVRTAEDNIIMNEPTLVVNRNYPLQMDEQGRGFVNVPWVNDGFGELQPLKIGPHIYDGTEEVVIEIYQGES